jgi:hypothetical protein
MRYKQHVWSKSASNEGRFILMGETVCLPCLACLCCGVARTLHLALSAHALQTVQILSKSVSNEGHFTRVAETIFHPIAPRIGGLTETWHLALTAHALLAGHF